jgi:hypothetical protein
MTQPGTVIPIPSTRCCLYGICNVVCTRSSKLLVDFIVVMLKAVVRSKSGPPFLVESKQAPRVWLRMRFRVLHRDRYRCRGCDKKAEEVTLKIHHIRPGSSQVEDVLTLCLSCRALARNLELKGVDIPDFLRYLWRHLHRRVEPKYSDLKTLKVGNNAP